MIALESSDPAQITQAVRDVISECYNLESLEDLTTFDIEYLFLHLRGKSVGEQIELQIKCEHCEELNPLQIDVNDIKVQNLKSDNIVMVTDTVGLKMRWPSVETFGALDIEKLNTVEGLMQLIIQCIESIFDEDAVYDAKQTSEKELVEFIENLNSEQFKKVQAFFQDMPVIEHIEERISSNPCFNWVCNTGIRYSFLIQEKINGISRINYLRSCSRLNRVLANIFEWTS